MDQAESLRTEIASRESKARNILRDIIFDRSILDAINIVSDQTGLERHRITRILNEEIDKRRTADVA